MSNDLIPRLLSGRRQLSRPEKDAIFERVVRTTGPARRRERWLAGAIGICATACVLAVIVSRRTPPPASEFAARGDGAPTASIQLRCGADPSVCTLGERVVFDLQGTAGYRYFAAFARHEAGKVIWYFPESSDAPALDLRERTVRGVVDTSVVLGTEHPTGRYRLHAVFSVVPLTREEIRRSFDSSQTTLGPETRVLTQEFEIQ